MSDPTDIEVARLSERVKNLTDLLTKAEANREEDQKWRGSVDTTLSSMNNRFANIESSLAKSAPTIEEFITIKHKVVGAGHLGKLIWGACGALLTLVITFRKQIASFLMGT